MSDMNPTDPMNHKSQGTSDASNRPASPTGDVPLYTTGDYYAPSGSSPYAPMGGNGWDGRSRRGRAEWDDAYEGWRKAESGTVMRKDGPNGGALVFATVLVFLGALVAITSFTPVISLIPRIAANPRTVVAVACAVLGALLIMVALAWSTASIVHTALRASRSDGANRAFDGAPVDGGKRDSHGNAGAGEADAADETPDVGKSHERGDANPDGGAHADHAAGSTS